MNDIIEEIECLKKWVGPEEIVEEFLNPIKVDGFHAVFDSTEAPAIIGDSAPNGIHWMVARSSKAHSLLGKDGHSNRGSFIPPLSLPRRMWAGSEIHFYNPLIVGETIERRSCFDSIYHKEGNTGNLIFVKIRHDYRINQKLCTQELQTLVYREAPQRDEVKPEKNTISDQPDWKQSIIPDSVLLFRYSALTFNGHRIHYDRRYCIEQEGYPGLLVHGPLQATLLLDLCRKHKPGKQINFFKFRAMSPVFDGVKIEICGKEDNGLAYLWIKGPQDELTMKAEASW